MIQRIQTLHLLVATILLVAVNFFPLATFDVEGGIYRMSSFGIDAFGTEAYTGTQWLCYLLRLLSGVAALVSFLNIFGYKNRIAQMRKCIYAILLVIVYYMVYGAQTWLVFTVTQTMPLPSLSAQMPLIAVVFLFLAGRAIKRDEDLVRSTERLR